MPSSHRPQCSPFASAIALPILLVLLATTPSAWAETDPAGLTFDQCISDGRCAEGLFCLGKLGDDFAICVKSLMDDCRCLPAGDLVFCETESEEAKLCRDGEACAISGKTGSQLCVSCVAMADEEDDREYTPAYPASHKKRCAAKPPGLPPSLPTPTQAPPDGHTHDFCSPQAPCADGLTCANLQAQPCSDLDIVCACAPQEFTQCDKPSDCGFGETCSHNVFHDTKECISCYRIAHSVEEVALPSKKCDNLEERQFPEYPLGNNGLTLDECSSDDMCQGSNRCRLSDRSLCPGGAMGAGVRCRCLSEKLFKVCDKTRDCPVGEVCIRNRVGGNGTEIDVSGRYCLSHAAMTKTDTLNFEQFGDPQPTPTPKPLRGLTNDVCRFDWDCVGPRRCKHPDMMFGGCAGRDGCKCFTLAYVLCDSDKDCSEGETCVGIRGSLWNSYCESTFAMKWDTDLVPVAELEEPAPEVKLTNGLSGDRCLQNSDCSQTGGKRTCKHVTEKASRCDGRSSCYCVPEEFPTCRARSECVDGEMCVLRRGEKATYCWSAEAFGNVKTPFAEEYETDIPSEPETTSEPLTSLAPAPPAAASTSEPVAVPTDASEPAESSFPEAQVPGSGASASGVERPTEESCVDARALRHFAARDLVFATARMAGVLCDGLGHCATPGHIVVWRRTAMMMRTYCDVHATCERHRMAVNSPRMKKGLRVRSETTEGFAFTALAARFETRMEEQVLTRLVHLGL